MNDYSVKAIRQEFKKNGVFYTQKELAEYLKGLLPANVDKVYDPTCGNGGLLSVFGDDVEKYGQEINAEQLHAAEERLTNFHGAVGDTLQCPAFADMKFDYIVANPPFSIKWEPFTDERFSVAPVLPPPSKADYAFNLHILHYLSDNGTAVVLNFPGILYRGNREGKIRQWLIENNYIDKVIAIPGNKFQDTSISTCVIVYQKNKPNTDITFIDDATGKQRTVTQDEVEENGFVLSVSTYIQPDEAREKVDPDDLERHAREKFIARLRAELDFDLTVCQLDGFVFSDFLDQIQAVIDEFRRMI